MVAKVYGVAASPYVATVLVCLEEAGASYELVAVDMAAGENRSRHHLARSVRPSLPSPTLRFASLSYMMHLDLFLHKIN
jgi:glutathione S-transferase